jgi:thiamine phosphate synthase YjbQ (UPF0047 family)
METFSIGSTLRHSTLRIDTAHPTQFIDLTDQVGSLVEAAGLRTGFAQVQSLHTTTGIVLTQHEPLLLADMEALLDRGAPKTLAYA